MANSKKLSDLVNSKKSKKEEERVEVEEVKVTEEPSLSERLNLKDNSFFGKNKKILIGVAAVITLSVIAFLAFRFIQSGQETEAQEDIYAAQKYFETDSLDKALQGGGQYPGFEEISEDFSLSKAGELSHFYQGVIFLKKGKFKKAIAELKQFNAKDYLVQARAYSLIGDAYTELNKFDEATVYYKQAINYNPNQNFTPQYMMKLALAYELMGNKNANANKDYEKAIEVYEKLSLEYPNADAKLKVDANKYQARLEGMIETKNFKKGSKKK